MGDPPQAARFEPADANRQCDSRRAIRIDKAIRAGRSESTKLFDPCGRIAKAIPSGRSESTTRFEPGDSNRTTIRTSPIERLVQVSFSGKPGLCWAETQLALMGRASPEEPCDVLQGSTPPPIELHFPTLVGRTGATLIKSFFRKRGD